MLIALILILASILIGYYWNKTLLKITGFIYPTNPHILGIATHGVTSVKLTASEDIPEGFPVELFGDGLVRPVWRPEKHGAS